MKLKDRLKEFIKIDCDWYFDKEERKICVYGSSWWGADTKKEYNKQEKLIQKYKVENNLFSLYCWCDISGYDYWMVQQEESNYVSIDVVLKKKKYTDEELIQIREEIIKADIYFIENLEQYNY